MYVIALVNWTFSIWFVRWAWCPGYGIPLSSTGNLL